MSKNIEKDTWEFKQMVKIGIIGSGVVGTATGKGFHKLGHGVSFYDISKQRLLTLREEGYEVVYTVKDVLANSDITFICVNTPTDGDNGQQDLSQLNSALFSIVNAINDGAVTRKKKDKNNRPHLLVFRSTMLPGTMRNVVIDYLDRKVLGASRGKDYDVCYNPEFLRQDTALEDFFKPDRVVLGEETKGNSSALKSIYKQLTENIITTTFDAAEMIKYASNCFLSLKISFFNEIGMICKQMGIDDSIVSSGVAADRRIGKYGTRAGKPFDGACLPKDTIALASFAKRLQISPDLLQVVLDINKKVGEMAELQQQVYERLQ